jgi:hypothetical protein
MKENICFLVFWARLLLLFIFIFTFLIIFPFFFYKLVLPISLFHSIQTSIWIARTYPTFPSLPNSCFFFFLLFSHPFPTFPLLPPLLHTHLSLNSLLYQLYTPPPSFLSPCNIWQCAPFPTMIELHLTHIKAPLPYSSHTSHLFCLS